jgi:type II secretory pathway pseudopilin PulG
MTSVVQALAHAISDIVIMAIAGLGAIAFFARSRRIRQLEQELELAHAALDACTAELIRQARRGGDVQ